MSPCISQVTGRRASADTGMGKRKKECSIKSNRKQTGRRKPKKMMVRVSQGVPYDGCPRQGTVIWDSEVLEDIRSQA